MSPAGEQAAAPYGRLRPPPPGGGGGSPAEHFLPRYGLRLRGRPPNCAARRLQGAAAIQLLILPARPATANREIDFSSSPRRVRPLHVPPPPPLPRSGRRAGRVVPMPALRCLVPCPAATRAHHVAARLGTRTHAGTPGVQNPAWARCDVVGLPQPRT